MAIGSARIRVMTLTERGVVFAEGGQVISELCGRGERQEDLRPAAVSSNLKKKNGVLFSY